MENWAVLFGIVGAAGGLLALADRLVKRGREDSGRAFDQMTNLASELRTELNRKAEEFRKDLEDERKECDDRIERLRRDQERHAADLRTQEARLQRIEDANGL